MKNVYVNGQEMNLEEVSEFLIEFDNEQEEKPKLPLRLIRNWSNFVSTPSAPNKACNLTDYSLPKGMPKGKLSGVYSIFVKNTNTSPRCFYVGMSTTDVRGRLRTHLKKDIDEKYRGAFRARAI